MEVPRVVRLAGASPRRYLDPKRELLVLFPAGDLHSDKRHPHVIELAVSTVRMTNFPSALPEVLARVVSCHFVIRHAGISAFLANPLWGNLDIRARINPAWPVRGSPSDAVSDHLQNLRLPVGRKCLVARPEIENFSGAAPPTATRSKDFSTLEPGNEN